MQQTRPVRFSTAAARPLRLRVRASVTEDSIPYKTFTVTLKIPIGITFAETQGRKGVYVEELIKGGNADQSGVIKVGDVLRSCSAHALKGNYEPGTYSNEGYGEALFTNWEKIKFSCYNQTFDNVMGALRSNNPRWGIKTVDLEFDRYVLPEGETAV